jgi:hypothetical protein
MPTLSRIEKRACEYSQYHRSSNSIKLIPSSKPHPFKNVDEQLEHRIRMKVDLYLVPIASLIFCTATLPLLYRNFAYI